jgi:transcriptional regulator with XRE-family HTH domain
MQVNYITKDVQEFGQMMRQRRVELGLMLTDVARKIGPDITGSTLGSWERGARTITLANALRWCQVLRMDFTARD